MSSTLKVVSTVVIFSDDEGTVHSRSSEELLGEEFTDVKEASAFIYGYQLGKELPDFDVIIVGKKYIELSIMNNDDPIEGFIFEMKS